VNNTNIDILKELSQNSPKYIPPPQDAKFAGAVLFPYSGELMGVGPERLKLSKLNDGQRDCILMFTKIASPLIETQGLEPLNFLSCDGAEVIVIGRALHTLILIKSGKVTECWTTLQSEAEARCEMCNRPIDSKKEDF